ncbi:hypothetical protein PF008_g22722 [Phytophthora fragariae]|uniref:phospholipase A2 n=1 Tax=Phytophthora fragariae TaxID=53985 RepID=A0A6G0QSV8_9STRA|nr:hypothetical protein PF008_g22722 [Phytophthora fragariae]
MGFVVGDVLLFPGSMMFRHLALYIGDGYVVHFWSDTLGKRSIRIDSVAKVRRASGAPERWTEELDEWMGLEAFPQNVMLERAGSRLGDEGYSILTNNCEHFVTWVRYGQKRSPQISSHVRQAADITVMLVGGVVVAAVQVAAPFRNLSTLRKWQAAGAGISVVVAAIGGSAASYYGQDRGISMMQ